MAEQPLIDISPENWRIVRDILQRYVPDREVWAFGSRAKWTAKEFSDLDIVIVGDEPMSISLMADLREAFQESALPFKVDIVDWAAITTSFREVVEGTRVIVQASSEWKQVPFGQLLQEPVRNGIYKTKEFHGRGCKVVNMGELFGHPRLYDVPMKRVEITDREKEKSLLQRGDLLFARRSLVAEGAGKCSIVKEVVEPTTFESSIIRARPNAEVASSDYLYYFFSSPVGRQRMGTILRQVAVSGITGTDLVNVLVDIPPIEAQKEIAALLSNMDDRIALLRETNTLLEAIAQALFKSWFIDFDPVRAKADGREPEGVPPEVAGLFPSEFEDSELGEIPKGWAVEPFGKLLGHAIGGDWGKDDADDEHTTAVAIVRGTDIPDIKVGNLDGAPRRFVSPKKLKSRRLQDGDLIIEVSGGSKTQATGRSLYCTDRLLDDFGMPVVPASFCRLFRPADKYIGILLAIHLSSIYAAGKMWNYQVQSTGLANFQTTHFLESELVVVPSEPIREAFCDFVRPLIERQQTADIRTTASLREALLPRLMSGMLMPDKASIHHLSETSE